MTSSVGCFGCVIEVASIKMKLFQFIQKLCHTMGFLTSEANPRRVFRLKTVLYLSPSILVFIPLMTFLLTAANSIQEYELSILMITSELDCLTGISVMICNMQHILEVIGKFEKIIEKSRSSSIFND